MFKLIFISCLFAGFAFGQTTQIVILSGHKTKSKAILDKTKFENEFYFHKDYPKLVDSKTVPGLKSGFWVWVAGYCKSDFDIKFMQDKENKASVRVYLEDLKYLMKKIHSIVKGAYTKEVKSSEVSCPVYKLKEFINVDESDEDRDVGKKWAEKPFSLPELSRFALVLGPPLADESNYLASYGYEYLKTDENLLQIIYKNNFLKE